MYNKIKIYSVSSSPLIKIKKYRTDRYENNLDILIQLLKGYERHQRKFLLLNIHLLS